MTHRRGGGARSGQTDDRAAAVGRERLFFPARRLAVLPTLEELIFANAQMGEALTEALVILRTLVVEADYRAGLVKAASLRQAKEFLRRIDENERIKTELKP